MATSIAEVVAEEADQEVSDAWSVKICLAGQSLTSCHDEDTCRISYYQARSNLEGYPVHAYHGHILWILL